MLAHLLWWFLYCILFHGTEFYELSWSSALEMLSNYMISSSYFFSALHYKFLKAETISSFLNIAKYILAEFSRNQSLIFIGRTDAEAETPKLWPLDVKNWLIGKDSDAGRDWRQEEKGKTEDEMTEWHYWLNGHEFEKTPGVSDGQGRLACCSPWGHKELDTTEQLNK